jgi:protein phosphatase
MIVGDGMGGHQKGELASSMGVGVVAETIQPLLVTNGEVDFPAGLKRAIGEANSRILDYSTNHPECAGMGTTLTAAVISESQLVIGHVGDSRAYLIDGNEIMQLTKDHAVVQEMVDRGEITKEQARTHPKRNIITRVVGYHGQVEADIYSASLKDGDRVLLCCDGLTIHLNDDEIKQVVLQNPNPKEASAGLVALAKERGGQDNISVIVAAVGGIPN